MTCPHLEETSALFDGATNDRTHADQCAECTAFLADAAQLRDSLRSFVPAPSPRRTPARRHVFAGAFILALCVILVLVFRPEKAETDSPFAGLDGGGRATITVKE